MRRRESLSTYDRTGSGDQQTRKEDPRLATLIMEELQSARTVLNVGAGRDHTSLAIDSSLP